MSVHNVYILIRLAARIFPLKLQGKQLEQPGVTTKILRATEIRKKERNNIYMSPSRFVKNV